MNECKKKIAIYIPNYNGADFLERVFIPNECDCIVMDNVSTDNSEEVCQKRNFFFIKAEKMVSRVDNWIRCIKHFEESNYKWMKWLFVGDELSQNAFRYMSEAIEEYPDAGAIVFDYFIRYEGKDIPVRWSKMFDEGYVTPQVAVKASIQKGYFGTPVCVLFSHSINFEELTSVEYEWAADVYLFFIMTKECTIAYKKQYIATFHYKKRKVYSKKRKEAFTYIEELDVLRRIQKYYEIKYREKVDASSRINYLAQSCIENNCHGLVNVLKYQFSVLKCVGKNLFRKGN